MISEFKSFVDSVTRDAEARSACISEEKEDSVPRSEEEKKWYISDGDRSWYATRVDDNTIRCTRVGKETTGSKRGSESKHGDHANAHYSTEPDEEPPPSIQRMDAHMYLEQANRSMPSNIRGGTGYRGA